MSLNDGVLDDIGEQDDNVVLPNTDIVPNKEPITLIPVTPLNKTEASDLTDTQLKELPKMDVKFKMVTDNVTKVADLRDVESDILGLESICKQDATDISSKIPGFFTKNMSLEHFTVHRSKVNYKLAIESIKKQIVKEEVSVVDSFKVFLKEKLDSINSVMLNIDEDSVKKVISELSCLSTDARFIKDNLPTNKNVVFPINDQFINIAQTPLELIDFTKVDLNSKSGGHLVKASNIVIKLLENKSLKAFIFGCIENKSLDYCTSQDGLIDYSNRSLSAIDVSTFFSNDSLVIEYIESLYRKLSDLKTDNEKLNEEWEKLSTDQSNIDTMYGFVLDKIGEINTHNTEFYNFAFMLSSLRSFILTSSVILEFYKAL